MVRLLPMPGIPCVSRIFKIKVSKLGQKGQGQKVRDVVKHLKMEGSTGMLTRVHLTEHWPWGSFTELWRRERYRIKRLTVLPGESLSLQMHHYRSEH